LNGARVVNEGRDGPAAGRLALLKLMRTRRRRRRRRRDEAVVQFEADNK
jgi:hypothetical protein